MADDRDKPQGSVDQPHTVRHASPPPPAPSSSESVQQQGASLSRGPRTLLLKRSENGFGFTLRHFIVYPPESCCILPGHERTKIDEPMDTIFVKQVRTNSPAAEAGLRTGDRVVSVDGTPTRGEQYASVVQRIQQAGPWLRLLVVSKEDDILQRYFGDTAHNPETNQRPRLRSPERILQKQRRSGSMIPAPPARTRQSWVCSLPNSESQGLATTAPYRHRDDMLYADPRSEQNYKMTPSMPTVSSLQRRSQQDSGGPYDPSGDKLQPVMQQQQPQTHTQGKEPLTNLSSGPLVYVRSPADSRFDIYDRTRPESIYSRPSSERIYDRIKDPIYERVRPEEPCQLSEDQQHLHYQLPPLRYPMSRAEPQVPIYRPGRRIVARRASEGSGPTVTTNDMDIPGYGSIEGLRSIDPGVRLNMDSRRDSSPTSKDSLSSFDSNSTLTGNECSDDSVIMNRLRKSFEQKEEFLRRPSHPIGWFLPDENSKSSQPLTVIQREFYARPQKLQRQIWPPNEQRLRQQSPTRRSTPERTAVAAKTTLTKPSNQSVQRIKTNVGFGDGMSTSSTTISNYSSSRGNEQNAEPLSSYEEHDDDRVSRLENRLHSPTMFDNRHTKENYQQQSRPMNKGATFVSTLSRIHENIASTSTNNEQQRPQEEADECLCSSLPSSPGPDNKSDKFPVLPQGLQIVSRRAKQFESGRLFSDDDEETTGDRTSLYKSELSRLSNKRSVPNVAVRKREFESKAESQEPRRIQPANRESKSLDAEIPVADTELIRLRARSNSAESWEVASGSPKRSTRHTWQTEQSDGDEKQNDHDNTDKVKRQDSYLQAIRSQHGSHDSSNNGVVLRRQKNAQISDEDRATRRVSYLKATWGERMHVDSDLDLSDSEPVHVLRSVGTTTNNCVSAPPKDVEPVEREGTLHIKFTVLDGKRSTDRSWKQVWGVLRGPNLFFYKDRHSQSPSSTNDCENTAQNVDVRCSLVDVAEDYTKRKHVLRVANPNAEVLLQTEDTTSMALWLRALHKHAAAEKPSDGISTTSKQQAVPQTPGPLTSSTVAAQTNSQRLSPLPSHKGIKKLTSFRNRSPTGQSPVNKTRKPSQAIEPLPSPKTKTWKGRVAKQFRRMHGQAGSPSSPTTQLPPEGATFKVPLELCPQSSFSEYVPLIVEMCTSIVEARGLEVIGIYRVPGNTAAISQLTDSVNKGFENINLQDPRWSDVNVISSLLKSFFRQLPDSLLTAELYPMFIDADKIEDPQRRMATIRKLLRDLPEHHFETLKYLMFHLKKIVEHSEINKMEAKNLAIVFGPTLVRASGSRDNMVTMVTDMSHQCRIVESLLNNVDWFFSEEDLDDLSRLSVNLSLPADGCEVESTSSTNHSLLLNNIQKVEGMREMVSAKDIVSSIISAANRKIQRRRKGQDETDTEDHDEEKKSKEEPTSLPTRQSMALNERQCSVSEIVMMHETKNQSNHCNDRNDKHHELSSNNNSTNGSSSNRSKYVKQPAAQQSVSSTSETSRLSSETALCSFDTNSTNSSGSTDTKQSNDEVTIRTYAGLSATTQERIRRFEQETKAMLQRDQHRQRREAEKREEERRRIEMEWQMAKREMENDDLLDNIVDDTMASTFFSDRVPSLNEQIVDKSLADLSDRHVRSRSTTRTTPLSIAVQQQPTPRQKAQATSQLSSILGEKINNSVIKKLKTDKEPLLDSICLPPVRYGSLDSLHDVHALSHSSPSPSQQQRTVPGDISDDGSDLLTSLTTTFDRKWKSLVNPPNQSVQIPTESVPVTTATASNASDQHEHRVDNTLQARYSTVEVYRDPSLHKSPLDKNHFLRAKDDVPEKDTDSKDVNNIQHMNTVTPDNDRNAQTKKKFEINNMVNHLKKNDRILDATEKDCDKENNDADTVSGLTNKHFDKGIACQEVVTVPSKENVNKRSDADTAIAETTSSKYENDLSYSNKLEKFESLANSITRSRLKRSESLNKRSENTSSKLKRSESLNKHSERLASPTNGKLKRSESLNKHSDRSESPNSKLKRSESLTKTEKTECNISKRRQTVRKESTTKLKRKNGMPERSIKRRHTVGGTKDFDKVHWLDNKLQSEAERVIKTDCKPKKSQLRTSSPDLSTNRVNVSDASFLIEVSFRGPSNVVFNVTNARPQSLPDANLASKVFKVPLESHV